MEINKLYEDDDYDKIYEFLSESKNKKLKINKIIVVKYRDMIENPDFEEN